jgi:hypothetical protein
VRTAYRSNTVPSKENALKANVFGSISSVNLGRMQRGVAPQENGVSMELHHIVPRQSGGSNAFGNLAPLWPDEHAAIDPCRYLRGGR